MGAENPYDDPAQLIRKATLYGKEAAAFTMGRAASGDGDYQDPVLVRNPTHRQCRAVVG